MGPQPVLILALDPALADDGYRVACRRSSLRVIQILRQTKPDLLIVSLVDTPMQGNWHLVEQVHNDPTIATRVIAVVDQYTYDRDLLASLEGTTAAMLPLIFDQQVLLSTVHRVIASSRHRVVG